MANKTQKLDKFVLNYDGSQYPMVPKFMKRRVDALKKLQLEHIKLQHQYNRRLQELELEFEKLHKPLYEKRAAIISGSLEPTDSDCQLPANLAQDEFNGDQENSLEMEAPAFTEEEEAAMKGEVKGLPGFWLGCLSSTYNFSESIEDYDRPVLQHLRDIELTYGQDGDLLNYKLDFHFDENPYFSNRVLTKTYHLKVNPDEKDPFSYEGFEVYKSEGCEINWNPGKDVTVEVKTVMQRNKQNNTTRQRTKQVERDSFFYFFKPPQIPEGKKEDEIDEELAAIMAVDFELGELIRQSLIPKAALYYNGFMVEDDDEDDDDESDMDDEDESLEGDESEDSDEAADSDDSDDSVAEGSADSLVKKDK